MAALDETNMEPYFSGTKLYGDDFSPEQISAWFADEREGYFQLTGESKERYEYGYFALNRRHGFRFVLQRRFSDVLGLGSAYGDELKPILGFADRITILEPSEGFSSSEIAGVPVRYIKPSETGTLPFQDGVFDLITSFGVLHHIPNVSRLLNELFRCLKPGGVLLLREPTISMGDWRRPRRGLTKRERGIPVDVFRDKVTMAGFEIEHERQCMFALTTRLKYFVTDSVWNSWIIVYLDELLCALPIWSKRYHPVHWYQKLRPTSVFFVLRKRPVSGSDV